MVPFRVHVVGHLHLMGVGFAIFAKGYVRTAHVHLCGDAFPKLRCILVEEGGARAIEAVRAHDL